MPTIKNFLLLLLLYLCCVSQLWAQTTSCTATISPNGPPPVCYGQSVRLQANTGTGLNYQWLRDGVEITGATSDFLLADISGQYTVRVSSATCNTATSQAVTVTVLPMVETPNFTVNPNVAQCSGTPIQFSIANTQAGAVYVWNFGDGTEATGESISHTYQETGSGTATFPVKVFAVVSGCSSDTASRDVSVNRRPAFTAPTDSSNFNVCVPDTQQVIKVRAVLTNTMTEPNDIVSYRIDFGDGSQPQTYLPSQFNSTTPVRSPNPYTAIGTYPITISAQGANGCETVFSRPFQISKKPEAKFSAQKDRIMPKEGDKDCIPVKVTVDSDSTSGENVSFKWAVKNNTGQNASPGSYEFIEGTNDTVASPILRFSVSGRYNLELIATNSCGADTTSQSLLIGYPEIRMNADGNFCGPTIVNFNDSKVTIDANLGTIDEASYQWTVTGTGGASAVDGTSLKEKYPKIRFPNPGTYEVRLRVRNECGFSDAVEQQGAVATITIYPVPVAPTFINSGVTICAGDTASVRPYGPGTNFAFYTTNTVATPFFTGRSYNPGPLYETTTYYVASINENDCVSATRTAYTITVRPAIENNTISQGPGQQQACAGQPITRPISGSTATGGDGTISYLWQSSQNADNTGFAAAPGTNNGKDYTPPALNRTTYFRRLVLAGACNPDTSNTVVIQVTPPITNNTINVVSGSGVICEGQAAPDITGSQPADNATIVYESSTTSATAGFNPAPGINNTANYSPGALNETTWFRRVITSGGCTNISEAIEITVNRRISNNSITGRQTVCSPTTRPNPIEGSIPRGGTGQFQYLWEMSTTGNDADFKAAPGNNSQANYQPPSISQTTWFRRSVTSGNCDPSFSNKVMLLFTPPIENNVISASKTVVCAGSVPTLTGTRGSGAVVFLWESSTTSATSGFNPAPGKNDAADYTPPFMNQNTWYRRTAKPFDTTCEPAPSNVVAITLEDLPEAPEPETVSVQVCQGKPATLRVKDTGNKIEWYTTATGGTPIFYGTEFKTAPMVENTTYYVQAVSANQCASTSRTPVNITVTAIFADAGRDTTIIEGKSTTLKAQGGTQFEWSPATGLSDPNSATPVATPARTTTYKVKVINELGCEATDEVTITVIPRIKVVNTFSPNQDGINETWEIEHIERYPNATVEVFNRWGNPVFTSSGPYQPWDGTFKGSPLPLATYYYIIRLDKEEKPISGSVTIIR